MSGILILILSFVAAFIPQETTNTASYVDSLQLRYNVFSRWISPEKLYVHMDRTCFNAGETIWFNGYLCNASPIAEQVPGNFIYAELLNSHTGDAVARIKVKRTSEGFPGYLEIPDNLESGNYTFRAYSLWQLNMSPEYLFNQKVRIVGLPAGKERKRKVTPALDISFYPEGGRYFAGNLSRIGFKAMDENGRSVELGGKLTSSDGSVLLSCHTFHDGMGEFTFFPKEGESYSFVTDDGRSYPLPAFSLSGATIQTKISSGLLFADIIGANGGKFSMFVGDATSIRPVANIEMGENSAKLKISLKNLMPGINFLMLVDSKHRIVSKRFFYVGDLKNGQPQCSLTTSSRKPAAREAVGLNFMLQDSEDNPLNGKFSVSVTRGAYRNYLQDDGIVSYLKLSSELKGKLNDPFYYFDQDISSELRSKALDMLLMIQAWSYYPLEAIVDPSSSPAIEITAKKEYTQSVTGRIKRFIGKKIPKNFLFSLLIPKKKIIESVQVDQANSFNVDSLDFEDGVDFMIKVGRTNPGFSYVPAWNGDKFATSFLYKGAPGRAALTTLNDDPSLFAYGEKRDSLDAAVVTASASDSFDSAFGQKSSAMDLEINKNRTLVEYVRLKTPIFEYDGSMMYNRRLAGRNISNAVHESSDEMQQDMPSAELEHDETAERSKVKLIVGDKEEDWVFYDMVYVEDILSVSISTQPDMFFNAPGGIVNISMKKGWQLNHASMEKSLAYFVPLGYQIPQYFYSPRYDKGNKGDDLDARNTLFWNPCIQVKQGYASIVFCNSDQMDFPLLVRIEGETSDGVPFSCHKEIFK